MIHLIEAAKFRNRQHRDARSGRYRCKGFKFFPCGRFREIALKSTPLLDRVKEPGQGEDPQNAGTKKERLACQALLRARGGSFQSSNRTALRPLHELVPGG